MVIEESVHSNAPLDKVLIGSSYGLPPLDASLPAT
jgi:hypothetical protein